MTEEDNIKYTGNSVERHAERLASLITRTINHALAATVTDPKMAPNYFRLADMLGEIKSTLLLGCGNHGCRIRWPDGVAPNGPCACKPRTLPAKIRWIADQLGPDDGAREQPPEPMRI